MKQFKKESLNNILGKFYKYSFGSENIVSLKNEDYRFRVEDQQASFKIYKEDLVNFSNGCLDYVYELSEKMKVIKSDKEFMVRKNYTNFYFEYFMSKDGVKILMSFLRGESYTSQIFTNLMYQEQTDDQAEMSQRKISSKLFLKTLMLTYNLLMKAKKLGNQKSFINIDTKFENNFIKRKNKNKEDLITTEEIISQSEPNSAKILESQLKSYSDIFETNIILLIDSALIYLSEFSEEQSFYSNIFEVIQIINEVEKMMPLITTFPDSSTKLEILEKSTKGKQINKNLFTHYMTQIIKIYLQNPNYKEKMDVGNFLNNLEFYVRCIILII